MRLKKKKSVGISLTNNHLHCHLFYVLAVFYKMKIKLICIILLAFITTSCGNNISSWVKSDVTDYSSCVTNNDFKDWLFAINSDGKVIENDGVKYNVRNIYDPETGIPGIKIDIEDGIAEYHMQDFLDDMVAKLKDELKNYSNVVSIHSEYDWIIINLKNEHEFNNAD